MKLLDNLFFSFCVTILLPVIAKLDSSSTVDEGCSGEDCVGAALEQELKNNCPELSRKILINYTPKGNLSAGVYEADPSGDNSTDECTRRCCEKAKCNFVFMLDLRCYLLSCNTSQPDLCDLIPASLKKSSEGVQKTPSEEANRLKMILVRSVASTPSLSQLRDAESCEVGIDTQCLQNEVCVTVNSRSRNGLCQCNEGFITNPKGYCVSPDHMLLDPNENDEGSTSMPLASTKKTMKLLKVSTTDRNLTLPDNDVALYAYVVPSDSQDDPYSFEWRLISHPTEDTSEGTKEGQMTSRLHLTGLRQGTYVFQVIVKGTDSYGTANSTVIVSPQNRTNLPPVAVISPVEQVVQLPTASVVLDASSSTDDEKIIGYKWELSKGPIEYTFNPPKSGNSTTLQIENLMPGNYLFNLTVEDSEHLTGWTTANITVIKETDYPPTANAGKDVVIYLPTNEVTLNGNASSDDKKIKDWEWKATGETKGVDQQDTHTPYLKLSHLQEGIYQYELKVTDEAGQSATSQVHVFVKKPSGNPPRANAGADQSVSLPQTWAIVDASASKADTSIVTWHWIQVSGPNNATILQANESKANVTGLTKGDYVFQLEVEDDAKLSGKNTTKVSVIQRTNEPPVANAGGTITLTLPATIAKLNGSNSKDDVQITSWKWERMPESAAAGVIQDNSDLTPILQLTELVSGTYIFKLTVKDEQGLTAEDVATLVVKEDVRKNDLLEVVLDVHLHHLKEVELEKFLQQMSFLLHDTRLVLDRMHTQLYTENAILIIHGTNDKNEIVEGRKLALELRQRLHQDVGLLQFPIVSVDTALCLDTCSGHGTCHDSAAVGRQCVCNAFWMENFLKKKFGTGERNCDWSKVYVGVVACLLLSMFFALLWSLVFLFRKNLNSLKANFSTKSGASPSGMNGSSRTSSKRHYSKKQYTLLDDEEIEMEAKEDDEEDFDDSDSDVLFETTKRSSRSKSNGMSKKYPLPALNGSHRNGGILKPPRRIKT